MAYVGTDGLIVNQHGEILLIKRDDSRTWAPPGGVLEEGESPEDGLVREIKEETGLITVPIRLVGLYFRSEKKRDILNFSFRAMQRGGEIATSEESLDVRYWSLGKLPRAMMKLHELRIMRGATWTDDAPYLGLNEMERSIQLLRNMVFLWKDVVRLLRGEPRWQPPKEWRLGVFAIIQNEHGHVHWARRADNQRWNLPGGGVEKGEAPWDAAVREVLEETGLHVSLGRLIGVYTKREINEIVLTFTATIDNGILSPTAESTEFGYFAPGDEPENSLVNHIARVADAINHNDVTIFKYHHLVK